MLFEGNQVFSIVDTDPCLVYGVFLEIGSCCVELLELNEETCKTNKLPLGSIESSDAGRIPALLKIQEESLAYTVLIGWNLVQALFD